MPLLEEGKKNPRDLAVPQIIERGDRKDIHESRKAIGSTSRRSIGSEKKRVGRVSRIVVPNTTRVSGGERLK